MTHLESNKENINPSHKSHENEKDLLDLQNQIQLKQIKTNIEKGKPWEFIKLWDTKDKKFLKYLYTVKTWWTPEAIRKKAVEKWLAKSKKWIQITNKNATPYDENHKFSAWDEVYVRIPKNQKEDNKESDTEIIDGMKCKWWEYFWIDISKFNEDIDLETFKKWNREKWDSEKTDTRWVSFVYIRASDWITKDKKIEKHVNKIKEYNNDQNIKDNNEKISVWFYHRMNAFNAKTQADSFLKIYNQYKDTAWWNNLVPMLDIEGARIKNSTKEDVRIKALTWLQTVEKNTWIIPGIYVTRSLYRDYFLNDNRFNKYLTRIAAYPESDQITKREIWTAKSIDFKKGTVDIWQSSQQIIKPTMYQSSQEWTVEWAYAIITENKGKKNEKKYHDTDMNHTKDITKLFSKNNKSK